MRCYAVLEVAAGPLRSELAHLPGLELGAAAARAADGWGRSSELGVVRDAEALAQAGVWNQLVFVRDGERRAAAPFGAFPSVRRVVDSLLGAGGLAHDLPKGSVELSMLSGGTRLKPHCGPTNHRLRLHLGVIVPPGATLRVGGEAREWREGSVLAFDDSFEHQVDNPAAAARVVLLVDIWHPEISESERAQVRQHFRAEARQHM
jgi:aspartate beta-hydroxylase